MLWLMLLALSKSAYQLQVVREYAAKATFSLEEQAWYLRNRHARPRMQAGIGVGLRRGPTLTRGSATGAIGSGFATLGEPPTISASTSLQS
jgi:hypothetical protein